MTDIYKWSKTAASNASADSGITWAEGQLPSSVNNSARAMMQRVAEWRDDLGGTTTVSGTNTLTLTANSAFTTYATGIVVAARIANDNTGAVTLNVNGIGAKSVYKQSPTGPAVLTGGELQADGIYRFTYASWLDASAGGWLVDVSIPTSGILIAVTRYTTSGTHTFAAGCRHFRVTAVGAGGAGGGCPTAAAGDASAGAGGNSGAISIGFFAKPAASTATVTIGAGGAGASGAAGNAGGAVSWSDGTNTVTANGGNGGSVANATATTWHTAPNANAVTATGGNVVNTPGSIGFVGLAQSVGGVEQAIGGRGADCPGFGNGGPGASVRQASSSDAVAGSDAGGFGAGGGGAATVNSTAARAGGAGGGGLVIVEEFY